MLISKAYASTPSLAKAQATYENDDEKLMEACRQFESLFMHKMLQSMRSTIFEGELLPKSNGEKIFTDMLDEEYADVIARNNTGGLAQVLFDAMKDRYDFTDPQELDKSAVELQNNGRQKLDMNKIERQVGIDSFKYQILIENSTKV